MQEIGLAEFGTFKTKLTKMLLIITPSIYVRLLMFTRWGILVLIYQRATAELPYKVPISNIVALSNVVERYAYNE